jgi:hypothetical protein
MHILGNLESLGQILSSSLQMSAFLAVGPKTRNTGKKWFRLHGPAARAVIVHGKPNTRAKRRNAYYRRPAVGNRKVWA